MGCVCSVGKHAKRRCWISWSTKRHPGKGRSRAGGRVPSRTIRSPRARGRGLLLVRRRLPSASATVRPSRSRPPSPRAQGESRPPPWGQGHGWSQQAAQLICLRGDPKHAHLPSYNPRIPSSSVLYHIRTHPCVEVRVPAPGRVNTKSASQRLSTVDGPGGIDRRAMTHRLVESTVWKDGGRAWMREVQRGARVEVGCTGRRGERAPWSTDANVGVYCTLQRRFCRIPVGACSISLHRDFVCVCFAPKGMGEPWCVSGDDGLIVVAH